MWDRMKAGDKAVETVKFVRLEVTAGRPDFGNSV